MLDLEGLKARPDLVARIDWEITPAEAFDIYQLKGLEGWRHRGRGPVVYFYLSTWRGENRVLLVERDITRSRELAEIAAPAGLVEAAAAAGFGQDNPRGQLPLSPELKDWLQRALGH